VRSLDVPPRFRIHAGRCTLWPPLETVTVSVKLNFIVSVKSEDPGEISQIPGLSLKLTWPGMSLISGKPMETLNVRPTLDELTNAWANVQTALAASKA
jgi:hypothetical protein